MATEITARLATVFVNETPAAVGEIEIVNEIFPVPLFAVTVSVIEMPTVVERLDGIAVRLIAGLIVMVTVLRVITPNESVEVTVSE